MPNIKLNPDKGLVIFTPKSYGKVSPNGVENNKSYVLCPGCSTKVFNYQETIYCSEECKIFCTIRNPPKIQPKKNPKR